VLHTPFYQFHVDHHAKFVNFNGWEMPISYGSILEEHNRVRTAGGLFDISHMGRIKISGRHARRLTERALARRVSDMQNLQCRYSVMCNDSGGVIDDVVVYKFVDSFLLVVNASNRDKVLAHLKNIAKDLVVTIEDQTASTAMIAMQGPKVMEHIGRFSKEVPTLKRYTFCIKNLMILKLTISRTGYTGEDGVEVMLPANLAGMALKLLVKDKVSDDPTQPNVSMPAGLGCRDTLRLEAGMPLYGHELSEEIDPFSAGLGWTVNLDKDQDETGEKFIGQDALKALHAAGLKRKLVGLKFEGKRTPRQGMPILKADKPVGTVTSGCLSPTLGYPIAMAFVDAQSLNVGYAALVDRGSEKVAGQVVELPFSKRAR
jgi:aminomethyltransferase